MALNTLKCNCMMKLGFKGSNLSLNQGHSKSTVKCILPDAFTTAALKPKRTVNAVRKTHIGTNSSYFLLAIKTGDI